MAPSPHGNLGGLLGILKMKPNEEVKQLIADGKVDALYVIGDCPFAERPPVQVLIYQNAFPPPQWLEPDLVLPAASWGEVSGSLAGEYGRLKTVQAAVRPPGVALQDWQILSRIAEALGDKDVLPSSATELAALLKEKGRAASIIRRRDSAREGAVPGPLQHMLLREVNPHRFRGVSLSACVNGMARIAPEDTLMMNPGDAREMGVRDGDSVLVESGSQRSAYPVMLDRKVPPALLYLLASPGSATLGPGLGAVRVTGTVAGAR